MIKLFDSIALFNNIAVQEGSQKIVWRNSNREDTMGWWQSDFTHAESGFLAVIREIPPCQFTYPSIVDSSTLSFHAYKLYSLAAMPTPSSICFERCSDCRISLEFAFYCSDSETNCLTSVDVPFSNGLNKAIEWDQCEMSFQSFSINSSFSVINCQMELTKNWTNSKFWLYWNVGNQELAKNGAFLIKTEKFLEDSENTTIYKVLPNGLPEVKIEISEKEIWVVLAFREEEDVVHIFEKLQSSNESNEIECKYDLYILSPQLTTETNESSRFLFTFYENHPFIEQYLENRIYSLVIPAGCSPTIAISPTGFSLKNQRVIDQNVCQEGIVMIDSPGYLDSSRSFDFNRTLTHHLGCDQGTFDIRIEIVSLNGGIISIDFQSFQNETIPNITWQPSDNYSLSINFTYEKVTKMSVNWSPDKTHENAGALLWIHIDNVEICPNDGDRPKESTVKLWIWIVAASVLFACLALIGACAFGIRSGLLLRVLLSPRNPFAHRFQYLFASNQFLKSAMDKALLKKTFVDKWEVSSANLTILDETLGAGAYAIVHKGYLRGIPPVATINPSLQLSFFLSNDGNDVAVKVARENATKAEKRSFLMEIDFMKRLEYHPHILSLLACSTNPSFSLIVTELCEFGDLLSLIWKMKKEKANEEGKISDESVKEDSLEFDDFVPIGWQLSDALAFLSGKKIIHRDVAARNVLLSDFGLCCYAKEEEEEYESKEGKLPLKWMAPESIELGKFSEKSDVWSFGVVLWEMYSFGKAPFESFSHQEILSFLRDGNRLEIPESTPAWIKTIIEECWSEEPMKRPEFWGIKREFYRKMEADSTRYGYLHFSKNYYHEEEETKKDEENVVQKISLFL